MFMTKPILNIADAELQPRPPQMAPAGEAAKRFDARMALVSVKLGAKKLGYNLTAVPPGKRAFPFHSHRVNEEMFYVIEGSGEVRIGKEAFPIRAGDIIACPSGGPESAHQIVNTGSAELRYLAVSTKEPLDVCEYPDSGKIGVLSADIRYLGKSAAQVGYWEGE
jgi:uncharacterized cupin superfamily protein